MSFCKDEEVAARPGKRRAKGSQNTCNTKPELGHPCLTPRPMRITSSATLPGEKDSGNSIDVQRAESRNEQLGNARVSEDRPQPHPSGRRERRLNATTNCEWATHNER